MTSDFMHTTLGRTGIPFFRLGLSATHRPGAETVYKAFDEGINLFFGFGFDGQVKKALKDLFKQHREQIILVTGAYNLIYGHPDLRRTLEKRLRQFNTDYIDCFLFLGVIKPKQMKDDVFSVLYKMREEGKIRAMGLSCHNRKFTGQLCSEGRIDVAMMRYNAAHPGAEQDIFPHLQPHNPGVISYTATRWGYLLRKPKNWNESRIPTAGECYRFVLTNPNVHVCLTAPRSNKQMLENLDAVRKGPLSEEDMEFMYRFGQAVHHTKKWFM